MAFVAGKWRSDDQEPDVIELILQQLRRLDEDLLALSLKLDPSDPANQSLAAEIVLFPKTFHAGVRNSFDFLQGQAIVDHYYFGRSRVELCGDRVCQTTQSWRTP